MVGTKPSLADLGRGQQLMDLAGNGQLCLVQFGPSLPGYYERDQDGVWDPVTPFALSPNIDWKNPNLKTVDLNGDGHADILITEDEVFAWYPSRAKDGFGPSGTVRKAIDEEKGPALVFADRTQSIYLADLSGDGLSDIVRIRNGEVCYWPNLGYARFGAKITMDGAPVFDRPEQFDHKRIRLADIDGSGTTDIIYLGRGKVSLYFNQAGNSWSPPHELSEFPATDNLASVTVVDLLGNGRACLVWSSPLPADQLNKTPRPMRYIDLIGGRNHTC
ncbi:MAG: FG-GAP repeat domain-containing protein [Pyrinomonadaceae bacterium]